MLWEWLVENGLIEGDPNYYASGRASPEEYTNAIRVAAQAAANADEGIQQEFWQRLVSEGAIQGDPSYYSEGRAQPEEVENAAEVAGQHFDRNAGTDPNAPPLERTTEVGGTVIPDGGALVRVSNPAGSDSRFQYFLDYQYNGVTLRFEVGGTEEFSERFGSVDRFDLIDFRTQAADDEQSQFRIERGTADEIYGSPESLASQIQRGLREFGLEDIPRWIRGDPQATMVLMEGSFEGFSEGRIWRQLSQTGAFEQRFRGFARFRERMGQQSIAETVDRYLAEEQAIRQSIRTYRGADADLSGDYIGNLIERGWTAREADRVLEGEFRLRQRPEDFANLNEILQFQGQEPVSPEGFIEIAAGRAAPETIGAINDAIRMSALERQGVDVAPSMLEALGPDGELDLANEQQVGQFASEAARNILRFGLELEANRYGIGREDVIRAAFGEGPSAQVSQTLAKFARERQAAAAGFGGVSAYQDAQGRLRVQGLQGL